MSFSIPESSERRIPQFQRLVRMRSNEPLHVLLVGTGPVEAIAGEADTKIVVRLSRSWRQPVRMDSLAIGCSRALHRRHR
jgi:hypothetical protein